MSIPGPPSPLTAPQYAVLPQGTILHRVHVSAYRAAAFNPGLGGPTRFAPIRDGAGNPVPSLYASATVRSAIHETVFHDIPADAACKTVRLDDVRRRTHSLLAVRRVLRLVELRNPTLGKWGISREELISSGPALYGLTAAWAEAVHRDIADADGLVWTSNQCDPDDAYLFFGDRIGEAEFATVQSRDAMNDGSFLEDVRDEGRVRGIVLTV